jgi:hypothetical protein
MESQRKDNRSHETAEKSACVNTMSKKKTLLLPPSLVFGASHSTKQPEKIGFLSERHKSP